MLDIDKHSSFFSIVSDKEKCFFLTLTTIFFFTLTMLQKASVFTPKHTVQASLTFTINGKYQTTLKKLSEDKHSSISAETLATKKKRFFISTIAFFFVTNIAEKSQSVHPKHTFQASLTFASKKPILDYLEKTFSRQMFQLFQQQCWRQRKKRFLILTYNFLHH